MKRILMLFVIAFGLVAGVGYTGVASAEPIKIGLIGTFQVRMGIEFQGNDMRDGALLALEQAQSNEKMKGHSFQLVVANDKGSPEEAVAQAKRLIEVERVSAILGPSNSSCALAVAPVVSQAKVPLITLATHPDLTRPLQRYVFRGNISDVDLGKVMADYVMIMLAGPDVDKVGILYEDTPYGRAGMEVVRARMARHGMKPAATVSYPSGRGDLS
ncbi:MAG: ABC transporter substrate-binding protein, partial [candidate division NC10 bacterium]|nr:ABC transporter substrate-binding protein [candidate division NC10 bacterium]